MPNANSCVISLPSITVPARCSRTPHVDSSSGSSRPEARSPGREDPARGIDVLVADRNAEQRARDVAAAERRLGRLGVGERALGGDGHERVKLAVELLNALEMRAGQLDRRERAPPEPRADVADRRVKELLTGHGRLASERNRT
jgi:hypothetical protein